MFDAGASPPPINFLVPCGGTSTLDSSACERVVIFGRLCSSDLPFPRSTSPASVKTSSRSTLRSRALRCQCTGQSGRARTTRRPSQPLWKLTGCSTAEAQLGPGRRPRSGLHGWPYSPSRPSHVGFLPDSHQAGARGLCCYLFILLACGLSVFSFLGR